MKWKTIGIVAVALAAGAWYVARSGSGTPPAGLAQSEELPGDAMAAVAVPAAFTEQQQMGERAYNAVCAACHGVNAQGRQGIAPPLVHKIYEPGHHGDMAFVLAAQNGVQAHHWSFGNMPAIEGVTAADIRGIVAYVRALQRENGID